MSLTPLMIAVAGLADYFRWFDKYYRLQISPRRCQKSDLDGRREYQRNSGLREQFVKRIVRK